MYKKLFLFVLFISIIFIPSKLHAETRITEDLYDGGYWSKAGSPYIIEDYVSVPAWQKLTIGPGVTVRGAGVLDGEDLYSIYINGDLEIKGTVEDPVRIENLGFIYLNNGTTTIDHTFLEKTGIDVYNGRVNIDSSSIKGSDIAISAKKSKISISKSQIINNTNGILSNLWTSGPFLSNIANANEVGGIGNAEDMDPNQNIIEIHESIFIGNDGYAIMNKTTNTIDATDNWWGSVDGPKEGTSGNTISGAVLVDPWKAKDPLEKDACCSNVLFLPGFEASRLYLDKKNFLGVTITNTLWEPNRNDDVKKLFMDSSGKSLDPSIYTSDIVDSAFGIVDIYKSFVSMMKTMVAEKNINEWTPFAYDWRNDISSIVNENLVLEIERLAKTSKTGKVSIIAHSYGGLVAKLLGKELEKVGKSTLLDKVILVATPQLGTPQAIAGMLHGDDQSMLGGMLLSKSVARTFGLNMPGAYGFIPSSSYFNKAISPIVVFATSTVDSRSSLTDFLTGKTYPRTQPEDTDLLTPALLSKNLLEKAESIHEIIDSWSFPTTTKSLYISGWGKDTTKTLDYTKGSLSFLKTSRGDGTVLTESSTHDILDTLYFNQGLLKRNTGKNITHKDILEAEPIRNILSEAIKSTSTASLIDLLLPSYISKNEPKVDDYPWLGSIVVSVHSPLDIDVYDTRGRHIGIVPLKDVAPGHEDSDLMWLDNTIGGEYEDIAGEKYVTLPSYTGETYSVKLKGTGVGTFTFKVEKYDNHNNLVASSTYNDLPVTPFLVASTSVNALTISPVLNIDVDGDGKLDIEARPSTSTDMRVHLDSMKAVILSLKLKASIEKKLLQRIEKIIKTLTKGKNDKLVKRLKALTNKMEEKHWNLKNVTENDKKIIIGIFEALLNNLEKS